MLRLWCHYSLLSPVGHYLLFFHLERWRIVFTALVAINSSVHILLYCIVTLAFLPLGSHGRVTQPTWYQGTEACDIMWCHVTACDIMWQHVMSCDSVKTCWWRYSCALQVWRAYTSGLHSRRIQTAKTRVSFIFIFNLNLAKHSVVTCCTYLRWGD